MERRVQSVAVCLGLALVVSGLVSPGTSAHEPVKPSDPILKRLDRYVPKKPGTKEDLRFFFGPYIVPPGWDANRFDVDIPLANGMILAVEPSLIRASDGGEPAHQEAHIHHAHWFGLDPGNQEDNYLGGLTEWIFGNGDEETRADYQPRTDADPTGPIYGQYIGASGPQLMIYMIHNKTAKPLLAYIALEVTYIHGTHKQLNDLPGRPYHDLSGLLFGRTFDVPRKPDSMDGTFETAEDDPKGVIQWTSKTDGTIIGTGSHLHPGGLNVIVENYGSKSNPCPDDGKGYGGTRLLRSDAIWRDDVPFTEDFQMEVTHPAWRAPIRKGDRIRISGTYENRDHAWYQTMTHQGFYMDKRQPPQGRCKPYLVGPAAKEPALTPRMRRKCKGKATKARRARCRRRMRARLRIKVTDGVPNRDWRHHQPDRVCGMPGKRACERPEKRYVPGVATNNVNIVNFKYSPGDLSLAGAMGGPARVKQGTSLEFFNIDQYLNIRHSVTTCPWPCNGPYVANYPLADGRWDSGTMGYDVIDGGQSNPRARTPKDLPLGKYSYFCRIHPWMRGAFEVVK